MPPFLTKPLVMIDVIYTPWIALQYRKANNTFLNSLRKNDVEAEVEFSLKLLKGFGSPVIDVSVSNDSLVVYVLKCFAILACRCGSVVVREREQNIKGLSF